MPRWLTFLLCASIPAVGSDCPSRPVSPEETLQRFKQLDETAQHAFDSEKYAVAIEKYREAACLVPNSGRAFYGLGVAQAASGDLKGAQVSLQTADRLLSNSPMPLTMLLRVNVAGGDIDQVKATLRALAVRFPPDSTLHAATARLMTENKMLDLALAESLRYEQAGGTDPEATVALAALENRVGAYQDAIRSAEALEQQTSAPSNLRASAAGLAGLSYESLGRRDEAIKHLKMAIQLAPNDENSYLALAYLYEKTNRFREGVEVLQQARKNLPDSSGVLLALGSHLVWSEQYEAGVRALTEVLRKTPDQPEAYIRLAEAYRNTGRPELEWHTLQQLAAVKPDYPMLHVLIAKAILNAQQPDYAKALQELDTAEKLTPSDADISYLRGKAYVATKRYAEAVQELSRTIELRPTEPSAYYQLGLAYQRLGQPDLAKEQMERMQHMKGKP